MKKSEKLLDAIGQIDDKLVWEAEIAWQKKKEKKGSKIKRGGFAYRSPFPYALTACALLAIGIGLYRLSADGGFFWLLNEKSAKSQENSDEAVQEASPADAPKMALAEEGVSADNDRGAVNDVLPENQGNAENGVDVDMETIAPSKEAATANGASGDNQEMQEEAYAESLLPDREEENTKSTQAVALASLTDNTATDVTIFIQNQSNREEMTWTDDYTLEKYSTQEWQPLSPLTPVTGDSTKHVLAPGAAVEEVLDFEEKYGILSAGEYRIKFLYQLKENDQTVREEHLYIPFKVVE